MAFGKKLSADDHPQPILNGPESRSGFSFGPIGFIALLAFALALGWFWDSIPWFRVGVLAVLIAVLLSFVTSKRTDDTVGGALFYGIATIACVIWVFSGFFPESPPSSTIRAPVSVSCRNATINLENAITSAFRLQQEGRIGENAAALGSAMFFESAARECGEAHARIVADYQIAKIKRR